MKSRAIGLFVAYTCFLSGVSLGEITVSNVRAAQVPGTLNLKITYDLACLGEVTVSLEVKDGGDAVACPSVSGDVGADMTAGDDLTITWEAGTDWPEHASANMTFHVTAQAFRPDGGDTAAEEWLETNDRWVRNSYADGAVTMSDRDAGLMWVYDAGANGKESWEDAKSVCEDLVYAGHDDWALSTDAQLKSMHSEKGLFQDVDTVFYWSSTPSVDTLPDHARSVNVDTGVMRNIFRTATRRVWPSREHNTTTGGAVDPQYASVSERTCMHTWAIAIGDLNGNGQQDVFEDFDEDGRADAYEDTNKNGQLDAFEDANADNIPDGFQNLDEDGLTTLQEFEYHTLPDDANSDDDGILDGWEHYTLIDPLVDDAGEDPDGDGRTNVEEYERGTDPNLNELEKQVVELEPGWSLIGAVRNALLPDEDCIKGVIWGWNGYTYFDTRRPCISAEWHVPGLLIEGQGYWVFSQDGGTVVLKPVGALPEMVRVESGTTPGGYVTIDEDFYVGTYEVTNAEVANVFQWAYETGRINADATTVVNVGSDSQQLLDLDESDCQISFANGTFTVDAGKGNHPCAEITWYGAAAYCNYLSEIYGMTPAYGMTDASGGTYRYSDWMLDIDADGYRLPTDTQWEYAARGGSAGLDTFYSGSDTSDEVAWSADNSGGYPHEVGTKAANELGIYDMSGNVAEWCHDWYPGIQGEGRVFRDRGYELGSWYSFFRDAFDPIYRRGYLGFRISLPVDAEGR